MKTCRSNAAFSLVEVMVALLILGVAVVGLTQGITTALRTSKDSEWQTTAALLAAGQIELLRADDFLQDGVTEGKGAAGLSQYQWKQTVSPTSITGLHEVAVEVQRASETAPIYELRTLLFDPPAGSFTNRASGGPQGGPGAVVPKERSMTCHRSPQRPAAFTLIELVISTALMALILTSAYACLNAGLTSQRLVEPRTDILQSARVALSLLSADLRCACPLPKGAPFLGFRRLLGTVSADNLDFATHNYTPRRSGEGDFCEESVFVEKDPKTGHFTLWRRRNPTLAFDPLSGGAREEIATGLAGLRLEYYDGFDWYDSWGDPQAGSAKSQQALPKPNSTGLPEAVRITLFFDSNPRAAALSRPGKASDEPPLVFQTIARLNIPAAEPAGANPGSARPPAGPQGRN